MADQKIIRKTYEAIETKAAEGENRTLIVTISTANPDRSKDVVVPEGMQADNYLRNPVVAAFHDYHQPAIGRTVKLERTDDRITAEVEFLPKGIYPLADILYEQYKAGFMNAWSIGFIPKKKTDLDPQNPYFGGSQFDEWELLEYSAVLVPDNPEALTVLRSKGISDDILEHAQHVEPEADAAKVEKAIAEVPQPEPAPQTDTKESRNQDGEIAELKETIARLEAEVAELKATPSPADPDTKTASIQDTDEVKLVPVMKALKQADKYIGIALRDYKKSQPEN